MADYELFELRQVVLQCGLTLPETKLAYKTYGELNAARDNVVVMRRSMEVNTPRTKCCRCLAYP